MAWHVYQLPPIDFGWNHLKNVDDMAAELGGIQARVLAAGGGPHLSAQLDGPTLDEFLDTWEQAKARATARGWEGDFRQGPVVFWVPGDTSFIYGFAFKQDNNGTTYVVSPVELRHLAEFG